MALRKLTLSAPEEVIEEAKRMAAETGTSVSAMFTRLLAAAARSRRGDAQTLGPVTLKATGLVTLPAGRSDTELLEEALDDRYDDSP